MKGRRDPTSIRWHSVAYYCVRVRQYGESRDQLHSAARVVARSYRWRHTSVRRLRLTWAEVSPTGRLTAGTGTLALEQSSFVAAFTHSDWFILLLPLVLVTVTDCHGYRLPEWRVSDVIDDDIGDVDCCDVRWDDADGAHVDSRSVQLLSNANFHLVIAQTDALFHWSDQMYLIQQMRI